MFKQLKRVVIQTN